MGSCCNRGDLLTPQDVRLEDLDESYRLFKIRDTRNSLIKYKAYLSKDVASIDTSPEISFLNKEKNMSPSFIHKIDIITSELFLQQTKSEKVNPNFSTNHFIESKLNDSSLVENDIRVSENPIPPVDKEFLKNNLTKSILFENLNTEILEIIFQHLVQYSLKKDDILFNENDEANYLYIIKNGVLEYSSNGFVEKVLRTGDTFGEVAMIHQIKRTGTMKCLTDVEIYALEGVKFRDVLRKINSNEIKDRLFFLDLIPIFEKMDTVKKSQIASAMYKVCYKEGDHIIKKGNDSEFGLFIIKEGAVSCIKDNVELSQLSSRDYFGQNSLFLNKERSIDVIASERTICYNISLQSFIEALGENFKKIILDNLIKSGFSSSELLSKVFIESQMELICENFKLIFYKENEEIYGFNSINKKIVIILEGSIINIKNGEVIAKRGDIYGDMFLFKSNENQDHLIAMPQCLVLEGHWDVILNHLNIVDPKKLSLYQKINYMKDIFIFSHFSDTILLHLCQKMQTAYFKKGDVVVEEGGYVDKFFLIKKGGVRVSFKNNFVNEIEKGSYFGEAFLLFEEKTHYKVTASKNTKCYTLSKMDFLSIVDAQIVNYLKEKISLENNIINLKDLSLVDFIGQGKFGLVNLVHNNNNIYAVKAVSRRVADKVSFVRNYILNERRILLSLDHPFIVKLVKTLKNDYFCFYLMEFINGVNLNDYLKSNIRKNLDVKETQFYASVLIIIVEYLYKKKIAHRDIKPDNIMIDKNGYLKLIDFGTAKKIEDYTYTVVGTPHYIAPEILMGNGYTASCDLWSVGICIFEIFYGSYPFGNCCSDVMELYRDILYGNIELPSKYHVEFNNFIKMILIKKPNQREFNMNMIKKANFFKNYEWENVSEFKIIPKYVPSIVTINDLSSFKNNYESCILKAKDSINSFSGMEPKSPREESNYNWAEEF